MVAFVTGASSGIGRDMAKVLSQKGYDLIITARDKEKLDEFKKELQVNNKINVEVIVADLSKEEEVFMLYEQIKNKEIDIFINNAGLGIAGEFWETDLNTEIEMIKVNDLAMHILFKLILKDMISSTNNNLKNKKYILNVSSLSGFMPGPKMSAYYATKAYMLNLTRGVYKELKKAKLDEKVNVSVLCPRPDIYKFLR